MSEVNGVPHGNLIIPIVRREREPRAVYADISEAWVGLSELYAELGRAISEARRARLLTQAELAAEVGITRDMLALYETGARWKTDPPAIEQIVLWLDSH